MKRLGTILMACALVLGLSQCKKENTASNANEEGEKVYIVLKVDDGQKSNVDPGTGAYSYESDDRLLVGYNGACCGELSYSSDNEFSGYITITESGSQPLYFYYIGKAAGTVSGEPYKFDISNQSTGLPVLACAPSSVNYSSGTSTYRTHLRNKCSLVEFRLAEGTSAAVTVGGMHTVASINFADGTIEATNTTGDITLYSESAESTTSKWAILLPQDAVDGATVTIGSGNYTIDVPAIGANGYFHGTTSTPAVAIDNTPAGPAHEYVDLGLKSGTLWATCNVGADTPEGYGYYFAWGETTPKDLPYNWSTYQYCNGNETTLTKYSIEFIDWDCECYTNNGYNGFIDNLTTLEFSDDAASANWGGDWRMPTKAEWEELKNKTTVTWTTQNGVKGCRFTASNGNSIFLPSGGYLDGGSLQYAGSEGFYWSSSLYTSRADLAWRFGNLGEVVGLSVGNNYRYRGQSVRAVRKN